MTTLQSILTILYAISNIAVIFGYIPQINRIASSRDTCKDVSIVTYVIWGIAGALGCAYSAIVIGSYPFFVISLLHHVACASIVFILTYKRIKYEV